MKNTQPENTKWGSAGLTAFDRLLTPLCGAPSRAAWLEGTQERGTGKIRIEHALGAAGRCQKGPRRLPTRQVLGGFQSCGVGSCLLLHGFVFRACRELAPLPIVDGLGGFLPKRTMAREHQAPRVIQGHLAWSEVLHKGQSDGEGWPAKQGRAW